MRYGFILPGGSPAAMVALAVEAEQAGWDGVFVPDAISIETATIPAFETADPWVVLGAVATRTERIRFGPMVAALPRRHPWKVAREALTLDHLSNGRLIVGVGLGAAGDDGGFCKVGEPMDLRTRAERLDESLAILDGLWQGRPFTFHGKHYRLDAMTMVPRPIQTPRIPLWVVAAWPHPRSVQRALGWDGMVPQATPVTPAIVRDIRAMATGSFDILVDGETTPENATDIVAPFAAAGATWWLETRWSTTPSQLDLAPVRDRIRQGPPRVRANP